MHPERIEKLLTAGDHDCYMAKVITALILDRPYSEALSHIPHHGSYHAEGWTTIARIHEAVMLTTPDRAHEWAELAKVPILQDEDVGYAYYIGTLYGFLQTAIARDKESSNTSSSTHIEVPFDRSLPYILAQIICGKVKLDLKYASATINERVKRSFTEAFREYFFPARPTKQQCGRAPEVIRFIHQPPSVAENFGPFDTFLINRLCFGILGRRPYIQKIDAIHHLLETFEDAPSMKPTESCFE